MPARFLARPPIGPQYLIKTRMRNDLVTVHDLAHDSPNSRETNLPIQEGCYRDFIRREPELHKRLKQHHIAAWLGITPESLSRLRRAIAYGRA